jgi:hypothetical protein
VGIWGSVGGGRRSRVLVAAIAVVLTALAGGLPSALAAKRPTPTQQYSRASTLLGQIPKSAFARGRRANLLRGAGRGVRIVKGKRACNALSAIDSLRSALATPTNWKHRKIPRSARKPLKLLALAEKTLLSNTGTKCGKPMSVHPLSGNAGGGDTGTPVPPPGGVVDNGQGEGVDQALPAGTLRLPKSIGAGAGLGADPYDAGLSASRDPLASAAADALTFFRSTDAGTPIRSATPMEPTTATGGHVVWYTGNTSVALSTNDGRTFHQFDPSSVLPDAGLSFCCDQIVSYSRYYHVFVWVSQYWCATSCLKPDGKGNNLCPAAGQTNGSNRIRIAVATPQDLIKNAANPGAAWTYWDITPQTLGQPANAWFDRSDLSLNSVNADWTVDIVCGNAASVLGRISLAALDKRGQVSLGYITDSSARMQAAQGDATTTSYYAGNTTTSQAHIWSWDAYSNTPIKHDIDHSSVPTLNAGIGGSDESDWYARYGIFPGAVETATVSGNTLYLAQGTGRDLCTDQCGAGQTPTIKHVFERPAIFISRYDVNSWKDVGERWLWNPSLGFGWPAMQTDPAGDVGIVFRASDIFHNAQPVAGFLTPSEQFVFALPEGEPHQTGDYYSLRTGRTPQSFVMTAQNVQDDPGAPGTMHWYYINPPDLSSYAQGTRVRYTADVSDPVDGKLPNQAIVWTEDGTRIGRGPSISHVEDAPGSHVIKLTATNGDGKSATDQITIRVQGAPPPPGAPQVTITSPLDGTNFNGPYDNNPTLYCVNVTFQATATGGAGPLTYSWTDSVPGLHPTVAHLGPVRREQLQLIHAA